VAQKLIPLEGMREEAPLFPFASFPSVIEGVAQKLIPLEGMREEAPLFPNIYIIVVVESMQKAEIIALF